MSKSSKEVAKPPFFIVPTKDITLVEQLEKKIFKKKLIIPKEDVNWLVVLDSAGTAVGFSGFWTHGTFAKFVISGLLPCARGYSVHNRLIQERTASAIKLGCTDAWCEVLETNAASIKNLERHGFKKDIKLKYYWIYRKNLQGN